MGCPDCAPWPARLKTAEFMRTVLEAGSLRPGRRLGPVRGGRLPGGSQTVTSSPCPPAACPRGVRCHRQRSPPVSLPVRPPTPSRRPHLPPQFTAHHLLKRPLPKCGHMGWGRGQGSSRGVREGHRRSSIRQPRFSSQCSNGHNLDSLTQHRSVISWFSWVMDVASWGRLARVPQGCVQGIGGPGPFGGVTTESVIVTLKGGGFVQGRRGVT